MDDWTARHVGLVRDALNATTEAVKKVNTTSRVKGALRRERVAVRRLLQALLCRRPTQAEVDAALQP